MNQKMTEDFQKKVNKIDINLRIVHILAKEKIANRKFQIIRNLLKGTINLLDKKEIKEEKTAKLLKNYEKFIEQIENSENEMKNLLKNQIQQERYKMLENETEDEDEENAQDDFTAQDSNNKNKKVKTQIEEIIESNFEQLKKKALLLLQEAQRISKIQVNQNEIDHQHGENKNVINYYQNLSLPIKVLFSKS